MTSPCKHCDSMVDVGAAVCAHCGHWVLESGEVRGEGSSLEAAAAVSQTLAETVIEPPKFAMGSDLEGIGGWLILVAIGLAISPFLTLAGVIRDLGILYGSSYQAALSMRPGLAGLVLYEASSNTILLLFAIGLNFLLYRKQKSFPASMILFLGLQLVVQLTDHLWAARFDSSSIGTALIQPIVGAAIWIPYLLQSERVRTTFVR